MIICINDHFLLQKKIIDLKNFCYMDVVIYKKQNLQGENSENNLLGEQFTGLIIYCNKKIKK